MSVRGKTSGPCFDQIRPHTLIREEGAQRAGDSQGDVQEALKVTPYRLCLQREMQKLGQTLCSG